MKKAVFFIFLSFLLMSCSQKTERDEKSELILTSYRLIDENRTDEAIYLLEESLVETPEDYALNVTLASAYAHKAGFRVQKLVPIFSQVKKIENLKKLRKKKNEERAKEQSEGTDVSGSKIRVDKEIKNDFFSSAADLMNYFSSYLSIYSAIPSISSEDAVYLEHSILLLDELQERIAPPDAIYRVVLNTVRLKYLIETKLVKEFARDNSAGGTCRVSVGKLSQDIIDISHVLIDIVTDLAFVHPKKEIELLAMRTDISNATSNLTLGLNSLIVLDEASRTFLQRSFIQQGFGNILECKSYGY